MTIQGLHQTGHDTIENVLDPKIEPAEEQTPGFSPVTDERDHNLNEQENEGKMICPIDIKVEIKQEFILIENNLDKF